MEKIGRRSKADAKWQDVKERVRQRDKDRCVCCRILSISEHARFISSLTPDEKPFLNILDPAHILNVGNHNNDDEVYNEDNIVTLCRIHHERFDGMRGLISGKPMDHEMHEKWVRRLLKAIGIEPE